MSFFHMLLPVIAWLVSFVNFLLMFILNAMVVYNTCTRCAVYLRYTSPNRIRLRQTRVTAAPIDNGHCNGHQAYSGNGKQCCTGHALNE